MDGETSGTTAVKALNVVERMIAVMAEVGHIGKKKQSPDLKYPFRGIDDITPVVQPLFVKHGVLLTARVIDREREVVTTSGGKAMFSVRLLVEHTFRAPDGSTVIASAFGEAMDNMDKASNKAMTAALKATLTTSFTIPVNDPEADTEASKHTPLESTKAAKTSPVAVPRSESGRAATFAPDEVEKEKGLLRALFETSASVAELDAHWTRVKKLPNADIAELTPVFKARKTTLTQQAAK